ncbi:hypothetical protein DSO57_1039044, partial [Entomophthora muscae]
VKMLQTAVSHVTTLAMFDGQQIHITTLQTDNQVDLKQQQINNYQSAIQIAQEEIQKFHQYKANQARWESSIMDHIQSLEAKPSYMSYKAPKIFQSELSYKSTSASTPIAEQRTIPNIVMAMSSNSSARRQAPPQNVQYSNLSSQNSLQTPPLQSNSNRFKVVVLPKFERQGMYHLARLYKMEK